VAVRRLLFFFTQLLALFLVPFRQFCLAYFMSSDIFESTGTPEDLYGLDAAETYKANSVISLSFSDGSSCSATVLKAFLPPTQSLVLLVNVEGCATVTNPAILKIHDSRFMESRDGAGSDYRPWSLELEIMAVERRDAITRGERDDDYDAVGWMDDPLLFEEHLHRAAKTAFETECEVYKRLRDLQGIGIPRCYVTGTVTYGSPDGIRARPVHPPFLLLEYIEGQTLDAVDPSLVPRGLAHRLLQIMRRFEDADMIHSDIHKKNIVFSHEPAAQPLPPGTPFSRVVVLDFGQAIIRAPDTPEDGWKMTVEFEGDFSRVCQHLELAGIRDEDPVYPGNMFAVSTWFSFTVNLTQLIYRKVEQMG
jgi:hypothetical protein